MTTACPVRYPVQMGKSSHRIPSFEGVPLGPEEAYVSFMSTVDLERPVAAVEHACEAADDADELLAALSAVVHEVVPHDGSAWFGVDPVTLLGAAPSRIEALDASLCDTFWHLEFHEQDVGLFADLARGDGAAALRLELDAAVGRSPRFREFLAPQGYDDELRAVFRSGDSAWGMVGLYREPSSAQFTGDDIAVLNAISQPIAIALRGHVLRSSPWLGQSCAPGLLIVDSVGHIVSANHDASHWLQELWPAMHDLTGAQQPPSEPTQNPSTIEVPTALHALVSRARAVAAGRERVPARLRLRDTRGRWLVLHASALTGPGASSTSDVAVVVEPAKSAEIAPIIIDAYALSPRERQVLGSIARGGSTTEIAAELFLSPHTVRDHIKAIFDKVGVSSRGELVAHLFGEHYADRLHETMVHEH